MDELIVAVVSRMYPDDPTPEGKAHTAKLIRGLGNNAPDVLRSMLPTRAQTDSFLMRRGLVVPDGADLGRVLVLAVNNPRITSAIDRFGIKLGCALHYLRLGRILPAAAGIWVIWKTNLQVFDGELPASLFQTFNNVAVTKRGNVNLDDQFTYRYEVGIDDGSGISGFMMKFRQSFVLIVMCSERGNIFDEGEDVGEMHSPFRWEDDVS